MTSEEQKEADINRLKQTARDLAEHFEAVQIFASRVVNHGDAPDNPDIEGGTTSVNWGEGNYHARYGQVKKWVIASEDFERVKERQDNDE